MRKREKLVEATEPRARVAYLAISVNRNRRGQRRVRVHILRRRRVAEVRRAGHDVQ